MGAAVAVTRSELTPAQLRAAACASEEPAQVRRLLAIALVLEGVPRQQAAAQCGMDRQTLPDWVHRYNEGGVAGLRSRSCPGRAPLLTPEQKAELKALVVAGPDPERDQVVRWRCVDLRAEVVRRFGVEVHQSTISEWLHQLGLTRLQPRPYHPKRDLAAQEAYEPLAKLWCGSARFVASGDAASAILDDCSGSAWYSAASERFWVTSGKPMAALPRNGGKALMSCLGANALR
jgi:transposase